MAVHVLTVLAYKQGDCVTSSFLAASVNTNPVVVRRLLLTLQSAKLVVTRKGAGFGSRLSRTPAHISLADVYRAVEDDEPFCLPPGKPNEECPVGQCIQKALGNVFASVQTALERELEATTLADILEIVQKSCGRARRERT